MSKVVELAKALVSRPSLTPNDAGCMEFIVEQLQALGFVPEYLPFGEVKNLWALRGEPDQPVFFFLVTPTLFPQALKVPGSTPPSLRRSTTANSTAAAPPI